MIPAGEGRVQKMPVLKKASEGAGKSSARAPRPVRNQQPDETVGFLMWDTRRSISRDFERLIAQHGVTRSTFWILRILWQQDRKTQAELAQQCRMKGPTIVGIVAQLEREKLVTRTADPDDNRKKVVGLTPKGIALRDVIIPVVEDVNRRALKGFSAAERTQMKDMLRRIRTNMAPK